jgi:hypothetical protein
MFYLKMNEDIFYESIQKVTLLEGEKIDFLNIYFYDLEKIENYLEKHNFQLLDENSNDTGGHLLFEKK